jgi:hypothetical protein
VIQFLKQIVQKELSAEVFERLRPHQITPANSNSLDGFDINIFLSNFSGRQHTSDDAA